VTRLKAFEELGRLKDALAERRRQAERAAADEAERQRRQRLARHWFAQAVGPVHPMPAHRRADIARPRPAPLPLQRSADEALALRETLSDEMDVDTLLETDGELSFRRPHIAPDVLHRLRRGRWAIQGQIDLHGLRRDEAREALGEFLRAARQRGLRCVRVIHGKGLGSPGRTPVLKGKVRAWLVQKQEVLAFVQARASDGGHGALVVLLDGSVERR
jgi:DNA-nicking Smr family endonuclease